jgi:hypothetical protein
MYDVAGRLFWPVQKLLGCLPFLARGSTRTAYQFGDYDNDNNNNNNNAKAGLFIMFNTREDDSIALLLFDEERSKSLL